MAGTDRKNGETALADASMPGLPAKIAARTKAPTRSIATLGLNIEAARGAGKTGLLLPEGHRDRAGGKAYPLPASLDDLLELSLLRTPVEARYSGYGVYVTRCRKEYRARLSAKSPAILDEAAGRAKEVLDNILDTRDKASQELAGIRNDVVRAAATLTDLYGLIRAGSSMIMTGFVEGKPVHGKIPTIDEFNQTQGKILGHISKLGGVSEDDKKEAEDAVFEQAAQATKKRLADAEALVADKVTH